MHPSTQVLKYSGTKEGERGDGGNGETTEGEARSEKRGEKREERRGEWGNEGKCGAQKGMVPLDHPGKQSIYGRVIVAVWVMSSQDVLPPRRRAISVKPTNVRPDLAAGGTNSVTPLAPTLATVLSN